MATDLGCADDFPGMTRRAPGPGDQVVPYAELLGADPLFQRPIILIATASISDNNIFNNGLYQNCFVIYRLAEAIGWLPIFVVNSKPKDLNGVPELLRTCRLAEVEDILRQPMPVAVYLEIGMSISDNLRRFMKMMGARSCKLYLGNILNIDIETPMFFPGMMFSHHVVGEQDEIWTSPHYLMNLEYAAVLNKVEVTPQTAKIAPYVWDSCILTDDGRRKMSWRPRQVGERQTIIIMEPNISFQKTAIIPVLIAEEYARLNPAADFELVVLNGDRLNACGYFKTNIEPSLTLVKQGRITYVGRHDMVTVMKKYPHATAICHHLNNEFNYMVLEFMTAGYPVLHNCKAWKDYGYFYPENDVSAGQKLLGEVVGTHHERQELYKAHAVALGWRHSIYNPDNQRAWKELLESAAAAAAATAARKN
jgi:hypothetical protein